MSPEPLDYHSTDLGAIASGETLLWSGQTDRLRGSNASAAHLLLLTAVCGVLAILVFWTLTPAQTATIATAIVSAVGGGIILLTVLDAFRRSSFKPRQVRFTDRRLVVTGGKPTQLQQLSHAQLTTFRGVIVTKGTAGEAASADVEVGGAGALTDDVEDLGDPEVESIPLQIRDARVRRQLMSRIAVAGLAAREAKRRWRRAWRPAKIETLTVPPTISSPSAAVVFAPELLPGERVLWSGEPALRWRADLLQRLLAIARSSGWIIGSAGIATAAYLSDRSNGALVTFGILGGLALIGLFVGHVWTPFFERRRLRRTSYTLTSHRIIIATERWSGTQVLSTFFDDATDLSLEVLRDGRGTISIGFHRRLERIEHAAAVHTLALQAIAGWREGNAAISPATSAEPIALSPT